jgi:ribosomal protein S18 acetylase RimI-like enzyme
MVVLVRHATIDDAPALALVHVHAWQAAYRGAMPDSFLDALSVADRASWWRDVFAAGPGPGQPSTLVGLADDALGGFVTVGPCNDDALAGSVSQLWALNVDPAHWGTGLADALVERGTEHLRSLGRPEAVLWVVDSNARARRFYERHGWAPDGAHMTADLGGFEVDEVRYRRPL